MEQQQVIKIKFDTWHDLIKKMAYLDDRGIDCRVEGYEEAATLTLVCRCKSEEEVKECMK